MYLPMKLLNHLGLAVYRQLHLMHLLNSLLARVVLRYTLLNLRVMHVIAHLSIILILILMSKTISTSRQSLIQIAWTSCKLRVYLLIELLDRVDAQSRVLHRRIEVRHFLLSVQVGKIRNGAVHVHRLVKVDWFNWVWHLNRFQLSRKIAYV